MAREFSGSVGEWRRLVRQRVDLPQTTVDELALHLDDIFTAALADGLSEADARARVMRALDESALSALRRRQPPDSRHPRRFNVASAFRLALRQFRQHPTFALVTVLVLGLGTGAATTVFTIVDAVVLRPLPYELPDRLVTMWDANTEKGLAHDPMSPVNFMDYRALPVFKDAAAWWRPGVNLIDPGLDPVRVNTIEVSGNVFDVLGVRPQIGAGFPDQGPFFHQSELIAVISDRLWRSRYSADPSVIGRPLNFNGTPYLIVGVMPAKFHYPDDIDVWQRVRWDYHQHSRAAHFMEAVGRLADGKTFDEAQRATETLALQLQTQFPASNKGWATRLVPLLDEQLGYYRPALMVLFGAVGLLLLIGCLNVASLLTRALSREREIAVRMAMGAAPRQLVTQLLAESSVLSIVGALVGVAAAAAALPIILRLTPVQIPRLEEAGLDPRALGLSLAVVVVTTLFFGLVPALILLRSQVVTGLRTGERGSSRGARRIYSVLVAGEVALACALLVSSALLVRTVGRMTDTPTGIDADSVLTTTVQLSGTTYASWRVTGETHTAILDQIRLQPGVVAAGAANFLPLEVGWRNPVGIEGEPPPPRPEDAPQVQMHSVSDGYFESMGAQMAQGRSFSAFDTVDAPAVLVVNESFAKRYLNERSPIGRKVLTSATGIGPLGLNLKRARPAPPPGAPPLPHLPPTPFEIVGVVKDIRNVPLGQTVEPAVYFTMRQFPFRELFITVRANDTSTAVAAVRTALKNAAPSVPMARAQTWGEKFGARTAQSRLLMTILVFFGGLAGLLAAIGVYGLFSWSVALRTRELAIRLTLGAAGDGRQPRHSSKRHPGRRRPRGRPRADTRRRTRTQSCALRGHAERPRIDGDRQRTPAGRSPDCVHPTGDSGDAGRPGGGFTS